MFNNKRLLVHSCCAPCSGSVFERLEQDGYNLESFFFNPNIFPIEEYAKRRDEFIWFSNLKNYKINIKEGMSEEWNQAIKGFEVEKEGGKRCEACFLFRLEETAKFAKENKFDEFTTVLTVSPHKNSVIINKIGKDLENKYNISFVEYDFKKKNGFKRSIEITKQYDLYRQNYCGCEFSIRHNNLNP